MEIKPPQLPLRFFRWFCHPKLKSYIEGDLIELYNERLKVSGKRKTDIRFITDVLLLFRPGIIRPLSGYQRINNYGMIKSYFKIGWRNMTRQKMYSTIKIGGFALGITACLLISLFINDELKYDRHYANADRIYRVVGVNNEGGMMKKGIPFPAPMATALKEDFPEVQAAGRYNGSSLFGAGNNEVRPGDQVESSYDEGFTYFDQELMDIFQLPFIHGNPKRALDEPHSIVITQRKADKYFPGENPIGKTLIVNNDETKPYVVSGVIEDFKSTSHLQFDFLISTKGLELWKDEQKDWGASNYAIYVLLNEGTDAVQLQKKITTDVIEKYVLPMLLSTGMSVDDTKKLFANAWLELQPLTDIHLHSADIEDGLSHGDIRFVWLFGGIAIFILLIAAINFINLSTARSANRAKEVGLRKVSGSFRSNIIIQFLTESILFSLCSFVIGVLLAWMLLPYFNQLSAKTLSFPWSEWWMLPLVLSAAVCAGILAGLYPSFYLSSFQPIQVLKGQLTKGSKGSSLRNALVVFQFTTSIVLIIGTVIIYQQMNFILNKKIGFNKDQVLLIEGAHTLGDQVSTLKNEIKNLPNVQHVSISDYLPVNGSKRNGNSFWHEGNVQTERAVIAQIWRVDHDYLNTMGMKLSDGRDFNPAMPTDSGSVIINQTMVKEMGGENLIGKRISNGRHLWTVIGVVEDFHFETMKQNIEGLCLVLGQSPSNISVKVSSMEMSSLIQSITEVWRKFSPHQSIRFAFLDDRYASMYADVQRTGKIFTSFAVLAIIVACLGLFALSAFMIEQRTKEIGIRLILGASVSQVFRLLTINFLSLVAISIVIAVPIAWYLMQQWLKDFVYRVPLGANVFLIAGLLALFIAFVTISYQSLRAGQANPVKSLRSE